MKEAKILIVTTVPETLKTILALQPRFLNRDFSVYLASSPEGAVETLSAKEGVPFHIVPMKRGISPLSDLLSIFNMCRLLLKLKPTVVHSYTPKAGLVSMIAAFICRVPVRIHTFTGLIFPTQTGLKKILLVNIDRIICMLATRVVPEGEGVKRDLLSFGVTRKSMSVIGYGNIAGVDLDFFQPGTEAVSSKSELMKKSLGIADEDFLFCYIGRLNRDKGLKELGQAFLVLPDFVHLIVVGELDSEAPVDSATLTLFAEHKRIHTLGFKADIRDALEACDALVLPSYREGFPNVVLQAGAMSKPAVVTDINGSNEIIEHGLNGWIAKPQDVASLQVAMTRALNTPRKELSVMGAFARSRIMERYDQTVHWGRMNAFYLQELNID
ncbi:glycosyltransferase family 4 protein [Pseudomonas sp. CCC3.1]|uniref:glycosyltransferase family 4 protein n=1 Tax=Pseudomonas sp. CCC3.1 TaxID=3048607 RepID=UPI002AC9074E|nr:glycosyltransferase family 4 protein [Pseudomonas sp. CCC3.1]MEB0203939.1 glycosyltransferase family 4 protein [Pseudomonas sp. CCC3.1]WPX37768.1 glycosyltransferase family 4 protein [Pseudomonas sp. CCC3.1]